jgi:hypothetical protein
MTEKKVVVPAKPPESPGQKGKKRGQYKQKECPYCHQFVGNLGNHVKMKHPAETPPVEVTKEELLGVLPVTPAPPKPAELTTTVYFCTDCKAELRKGEENCWHCGAVMNWEGI